jgi:hypothetical protein
MQSA